MKVCSVILSHYYGHEYYCIMIVNSVLPLVQLVMCSGGSQHKKLDREEITVMVGQDQCVIQTTGATIITCVAPQRFVFDLELHMYHIYVMHYLIFISHYKVDI